jgi:hypothetical protein
MGLLVLMPPRLGPAKLGGRENLLIELCPRQRAQDDLDPCIGARLEGRQWIPAEQDPPIRRRAPTGDAPRPQGATSLPRTRSRRLRSSSAQLRIMRSAAARLVTLLERCPYRSGSTLASMTRARIVFDAESHSSR